MLGPYNEHFAKDVGAAYLATAVLAAIAFVYLGNRALMLATALTLSTFNLLHLIYHVPMLHMYGPLDAALNAISLSMVLVCSVVIALPVEATADSVTADT
ncbi:hypothetical protein [Mycolicibacter engbaekii]|uniref:hypothetical protein n=1 Tax=Mycolicibacter engbaekii TaxID=188915 RepID=UPI001F172164|nr:hypothetical protein [Mycolicibacter engbaekii]